MEQYTFAMDHRELTEAMLADWGIAEEWVNAVKLHEDPYLASITDRDMTWKRAALLAIAASLGSVCAEAAVNRPAALTQLHRTAQSLGFSWETLLPIFELSAREWANWAEFLGIKTPELPTFPVSPSEIAAGFRDRPSGILSLRSDEEYRFLLLDPDPASGQVIRAYIPDQCSLAIAQPRADGLQEEVIKDGEEIRKHLLDLAVLNRKLEEAALMKLADIAAYASKRDGRNRITQAN
jgi:hypothetical protein